MIFDETVKPGETRVQARLLTGTTMARGRFRRQSECMASGTGFAGLDLQPAAPRRVQQEPVPRVAEDAVENMRARQGFQDGSAAHDQLAEFFAQTRVVGHVVQSQ